MALIFLPALAVGQVIPDQSRLLEIQHAYQRGEIDVEAAAREQIRLLYEPSNAVGEEKVIEKCAAPAFMFLHQHKDELTLQTLQKLEDHQTARLKSRNKATDKSYISPYGKFEIFYYTSGDSAVSQTDNDGNGVPDYIDRVAESADSSYRHMVQTIGFSDPIPSGATYKVYVENNLPQSAYGYTSTSSSSPGGTYIAIEADFDGFPENTHPDGDQTGAIYATMAHEFKHAIQYEQNRWQSPSGGFDWSEMDATLMEEIVYDDVNDYYNYIKNGVYSNNPNSNSIFFAPNLSTPGAYYHVSWMIFYWEAFGNDLWRNVWQLIEDGYDVNNHLSIDEALLNALPDYATNFETTFVQNHLWHLASGPRAGNDDYGFEEKEFYPYSNIDASFTLVPEQGVQLSNISKLAARYVEVIPSSNDLGPVEVAVDFDSSQVGLGLLFYMKNGEMLELLDTGENKAQVYVPSEINWSEIDKLGVVVTNYGNSTTTRNLTLQFGKSGNPINIKDPKYKDIPDAIKVYQNYPNPFNPSTNITFELPRSAMVKLVVYDITGRKVQTLVNGNLDFGEYSIPFNADDLSSGVYIYRLSIDDMVFTKKMTLVK